MEKLSGIILLEEKKNDIYGSTLVYSNNSIFISGQRAIKNKFSLKSILKFNSRKKTQESANYISFIARLNGKGEIVWENDDFEDQKVGRAKLQKNYNINDKGAGSKPFKIKQDPDGNKFLEVTVKHG